MTSSGTTRLYRPDPTRVGRDERWGLAWATSSTSTDPVVVSVRGEVDASNGADLAGYVERHAGIAGTLVLDLSGIEFFGTAGLAALRRVDLCCNRMGWTFVPSAAVRRVLRACRAEDLPQSENVAAAVRSFGPLESALT